MYRKRWGGYVICIGVELLRCSFRLVGQCEKPWYVERATGMVSTSFFVYVGIDNNQNFRMLNRGDRGGNEFSMEVKENLISFKVLWKGDSDRVEGAKRTKEIVTEWLSNGIMEISIELCGASKNGPIDLVFESKTQNCKLVKMFFCELIDLFRQNAEVDKIWLKWNNITDEIIWTDKVAKFELNNKFHEKGDYILIHQNNDL